MSDSTRSSDFPSSATAGARDFGDSSGTIGDSPRRAGPGPAGDAGSAAGGSARDFGDSAGYGGGGSTRDYRDVVGEDESLHPRRPNPLDAVMTIGPRPAPRPRAPRVEGNPSLQIALAAVALMGGSLAVLAWQRARDERERARMEALHRRGSAREDLARFQV